MIKPYLNILVMLLFSWGLYGSCQQDPLLPMMAGGVAIVSFLGRLRSAEKQYRVFEKIPLSVVIIFSFLAGLFWRNIIPIPEYAVSPYPEYTAALQSGSVFAAILFWLRPLSKTNMSRLVFCSWLTVALAMNVPFTEERLMIFSAFCFISIAVIIFNTMKKPVEKKYRFIYIRDYIIFSTLLIMLTTGLFLGISTSVVAFERAFMRTMSEFIMPRQYTNFLRISSKLNLISPGMSAFDRRPVMEIRVPKSNGAYLKLQVFDTYNNGTWNEPKNVSKDILPTELLPGQPAGKITMFAAFQNIIPAPSGITAVKAKLPYMRSQDQIITTENQQHTRILEFTQAANGLGYEPVELSQEEFEKYTALPDSIAPELKKIAQSITGDESDINSKAIKLLQYFHQNFQYSLDVSFSADDKGLLKMLEEKRPAYCTYFASALALLLRAEGIPARVGAGFLTTEMIDRKSNTYLARVNNAHAWTEVLVPSTNTATGQTMMSWQTLDATPPTFSAELKKPAAFNLEGIFEGMWLNVLRMNAQIDNMDKDKLKLNIIFGLMVVMAYMNRQKIVSGVAQWIKNERGVKKVRYKTPDRLRLLYSRYEAYLKEEFGETRSPFETDKDVLVRIKDRLEVDKTAVNRIEKFVKEFQAARFGTKSAEKLEELLDEKFYKKHKKGIK